MNASIEPARLSDTPACPPGDLLTFRFRVWTVILFIILSFALGAVPFLIAKYKTPANQVFLGQINNYPDYNMYFSFIRQSYDGRWVFDNSVTYQPSRKILVNLEWLGLGKIMKFFDLSENSLLQLWRFLGAVSLIGGFAFLAANFHLSRKRWVLALAIFSLGGGFGSLICIAVAAHLLPASMIQSLAIDMWGNLHPFQVIMGNPHAAVATGIALLGFGLFLISEQRQSFWFAGLTGLVFSICGFVRPYDLLSLVAILIAFTFIESVLTGFSFPKTVRRLTPAVVILPALAYNIWVFKFDPIYKYWGTQNHNSAYLPHIYIYFLAFGLAGWLGLSRILQAKTQPLTMPERFLLIWFMTIFGIVYAGTVIPALSFSPQIGYTLIAPLVILGVLLKRFNWIAPNFDMQICSRTALALVVLLVAFANFGTIGYYSLKFFSGKTFQTGHRLEVYANKPEYEAWRWIKDHLPKEQLIMGMPTSCNLLAKYSSLRVVDGHWSVTPHYYELADRLYAFYDSRDLGVNEEKLIKQFKPDYIYFGPDERRPAAAGGNLEKSFAPSLVYQNEVISIYKVNANPVNPPF